MNRKLIELIKRFPEKRILVIGDVMLDCFIEGISERISPEAPVPIVLVQEESYMPGGAANTANNLATTGIKTDLMGVIGKDGPAQKLLNLLRQKKINTNLLLQEKKYPTTLKTRITVRGRHVLRVDWEKIDYINKSTEEKAIKFLQKFKNQFDAIIISDYGKGFLTENLVKAIFATFSNKPIIVDSKPEHINWFTSATLIAPNRKEAILMAQPFRRERDINKIGQFLKNKFNANFLITLSEKGMTLFAKNEKPFYLPVQAKTVRDVAGAGDTVTALAAASLAAGANLKQAAIIANQAAGIVVGKLGTATVTTQELIDALKNNI